MEYLLVKWLHILSSTILFGTGIGSAFYMLATILRKETRPIASVTSLVVLADWVFTTPAIIVQPLTGFYLIYLAGYELSQGWIIWSIVLYFLAGACWLPVVWLQIRMQKMSKDAVEKVHPLPALFWIYFRYWILLGIPAFMALVLVFYLMVAKPI
ncbi:DUF2269 domain-containing protein [Methylobacillus caricis]|uniref:DUF2269 family protein n=1 Tax=Methylobacillus caricis TaxID=1971611 RepID=UPI001D001472|nr:DUF2269 domain-containing protein [Methylobacillus caricis]MCB5186466.1 DUF2269 domain-containing protein [Methylobacillus caricis]